MDYFDLDYQQKRALDLILSGMNSYVSGKAGTGKSTLIRNFIVEHQLRNEIETVLLAPTGVAAQNINGVTIHKFFKFPITLITEENIYRLSPEQNKKMKSIRTILIDEISMVNANLFWAMDFALKNATENFHMPFGGVQIIVVGDFAQLPPIISSTPLKEFMLNKHHGTFAFQTNEWKEACFNTVELTNQHRQDYQEFANILDVIRCAGNHDLSLLEQALNVLNSRCLSTLHTENNSTALCAYNRDADFINSRELEKLVSPGTTFIAYEQGQFSENQRPAEKNLTIKIGAKVMIRVNEILVEKGYINGDTGTVIDFENTLDSQWVEILLDRTDQVITVFMHKWQEYEYELNGSRLIKKVVAEFFQIPLQLAYGISIHKAQGKTLSKARLELGEGNCFAPGQLYVALSRLKSMDGLSFNRPLRVSDILISQDVVDFYDAIERKYGFGGFPRSCMRFDSSDSYGMYSPGPCGNEIVTPV